MGSKGSQYVGLTTLPPSCAECHDIWEPQPPGTLKPCTGFDFLLPLVLNIYEGHTESHEQCRIVGSCATSND